MTKKRKIIESLELTFAFVHQLIDEPKLIELLPDKFLLKFIGKKSAALYPVDINRFDKNSKKLFLRLEIKYGN